MLKALSSIVIVWRVCPPWIAKNEGGATPTNLIITKTVRKNKVKLPIKVPRAKGTKGTPITGADKLINQLGRIGVILRNTI